MVAAMPLFRKTNCLGVVDREGAGHEVGLRWCHLGRHQLLRWPRAMSFSDIYG